MASWPFGVVKTLTCFATMVALFWILDVLFVSIYCKQSGGKMQSRTGSQRTGYKEWLPKDIYDAHCAQHVACKRQLH